MSQAQPELGDYEAWRDLQDVLEERDPEWWADAADAAADDTEDT